MSTSGKAAKQKSIIRNYYANRESIMMQTLSEIVSELYLAESDRKRNQLWQRAEKALRNLGVKEAQIASVMSERSAEKLAKFLNSAF